MEKNVSSDDDDDSLNGKVHEDEDNERESVGFNDKVVSSDIQNKKIEDEDNIKITHPHRRFHY